MRLAAVAVCLSLGSCAAQFQYSFGRAEVRHSDNGTARITETKAVVRGVEILDKLPLDVWSLIARDMMPKGATADQTKAIYSLMAQAGMISKAQAMALVEKYEGMGPWD